MGRPRKVDAVRPSATGATIAHKKTGYVKAPEGISEQSKKVWDTYWKDPVSNVAASVDTDLILRWIKAVDLYERLMADFEETQFTYDERMMKKVNPAFNVAETVLSRILKYEAQLGIGPKNRINLGLTLASTARTLDALNTEYEEADDERSVREDPRQSTIIGRVES